MDAGTQLLLLFLVCILVCLIILLLRQTHFLHFFVSQKSLQSSRAFRWILLEQNSEESRGILKENACPSSTFDTKTSPNAEQLTASIRDSIARIQELGSFAEQLPRHYLLPAEDIHCTLEVASPVTPMADVHRMLAREKEEQCPSPSHLRRAISTDSVDSTASSLFEHERPMPLLKMTLSYDERSQMISCEVSSLCDIANIDGQIWMLFFLLPHSKPLWRTEARRSNSSELVYNCLFQQCVRKNDLEKIAVFVQLYSSTGLSANAVGSARLRLKDFNILLKPQYIELALPFSKTKNGTDDFSSPSLDAFIRVYIVQSAGKVVKKKTSLKPLVEGGATFLESISVPINMHKLEKCHVRLSVICGCRSGEPAKSIGHITLGSKTGGRELGQWMRVCRGEIAINASWHHIRPRNSALV